MLSKTYPKHHIPVKNNNKIVTICFNISQENQFSVGKRVNVS